MIKNRCPDCGKRLDADERRMEYCSDCVAMEIEQFSEQLTLGDWE